MEIKKTLVETFFYRPGTLIEFDNKKELTYVNRILDIVWNRIIDSEHAFEILTDDFQIQVLGRMLDRLKLLKPTMLMRVKATYSKNFEKYYSEAMQAWLYGLNNSAIVLCSSILEDRLEEILTRIIPSYEKEKFEKLVDHANTLNIIDDDTTKEIHHIRRLRNHCLHHLEDISSKTSLEMVVLTKDIIVKLFSL